MPSRGESVKELIDRLESRTIRYSRDHGEPNPSRAFPVEVVFSMEEWKEISGLLVELQAQQKGEKMPTFPYTDSAKPLPEAIELYEAAMAHGYKLVPIDQSAASEERTLREALIEAGDAIHKNHAYLANTLRQCAHMDCCAVVKALDTAALQSVPSSLQFSELFHTVSQYALKKGEAWRIGEGAEIMDALASTAPSDAGQPTLEGLRNDMHKLFARWAEQDDDQGMRAGVWNLIERAANLPAPPALEKLRGVEEKEPVNGMQVLVRGEIVGVSLDGGVIKIRIAGLGFPQMTFVEAEMDHWMRNVSPATPAPRPAEKDLKEK